MKTISFFSCFLDNYCLNELINAIKKINNEYIEDINLGDNEFTKRGIKLLVIDFVKLNLKNLKFLRMKKNKYKISEQSIKKLK